MVPGLRSPQRAGGTSLSDLIAGRRQRGEVRCVASPAGPPAPHRAAAPPHTPAAASPPAAHALPQLPLEVQAFLLVGRVLQKQEGGRVVTGVVKYWQPTFGHGRHHGEVAGQASAAAVGRLLGAYP